MMKLNIQLFASTNKTTNYELPQFVGSDKPTWLGDFNTAMSTIDTGMHTNASAITSLGTRVTSAEGVASQASTDVATLTSTVSTLSGNVTSATTTANNAQSTATSALNTANSADGKADTNASAISALTTRVATCEDNIADFNLTNNTSIVKANMEKTGTLTINDASFVNIAYNSDGSLAKIYGVVIAQSMGGNGSISMQTPLRPATNIEFRGCATSFRFAQGTPLSVYGMGERGYNLATDGTLTIQMYKTSNATTDYVQLNANLLYIKDFGDTPEE